jgi:hypothetical protein
MLLVSQGRLLGRLDSEVDIYVKPGHGMLTWRQRVPPNEGQNGMDNIKWRDFPCEVQGAIIANAISLVRCRRRRRDFMNLINLLDSIRLRFVGLVQSSQRDHGGIMAWFIVFNQLLDPPERAEASTGPHDTPDESERLQPN